MQHMRQSLRAVCVCLHVCVCVCVCVCLCLCACVYLQSTHLLSVLLPPLQEMLFLSGWPVCVWPVWRPDRWTLTVWSSRTARWYTDVISGKSPIFLAVFHGATPPLGRGINRPNRMLNGLLLLLLFLYFCDHFDLKYFCIIFKYILNVLYFF